MSKEYFDPQEFLESLPDGRDYERDILFRDKLNRMSPKAKEIVNLILKPTAELEDYLKVNSYELNVMILRGYLRFNGWKCHQIVKAIHEIKINFND